MKLHRIGVIALIGAVLAGALAGCTPRATTFANPDPALNRRHEEFAADAAARGPYKADAPRDVEPDARAQVAYGLKRLELVNFSGRDWTDVEVWVNQRYVCHLPRMEDRVLKRLPFVIFYDGSGENLSAHGPLVVVKQVELFRDGVMYSIQHQVAE
jgi:hypothetical protein